MIALNGRTVMVSKSTVLGAAGEHYVMCQLLRRGLIAALAPAGVPNADVVVTDQIGSRLCAVQVKSRVEKGSDGGWHMKKKHEELASPSLFYAFVDFGRQLTDQSQCFIVPSSIVANVIRHSHQTWLQGKGRGDRLRQDSEFRRFLPDFDRMGIMIGCGAGWLDPYRDAWEQLT
jgi:hypothetical protein